MKWMRRGTMKLMVGGYEIDGGGGHMNLMGGL